METFTNSGLFEGVGDIAVESEMHPQAITGSWEVSMSLKIFIVAEYHGWGSTSNGSDFSFFRVYECGGEFIRAPRCRVTGNLHCDRSVIASNRYNAQGELGFLILDIRKSSGHVYAANSADLRRTIVGGDVYAPVM